MFGILWSASGRLSDSVPDFERVCVAVSILRRSAPRGL